MLFDDLLGAVTTDEKGHFEIKYDKEDFQELFFDNNPDIFLKIKNPAGLLIYTTEDAIRYGASPSEEFNIKISRHLIEKPATIQTIVSNKEGADIQHPDGLYLQISPGTFSNDATIYLSSRGSPAAGEETLATLGKTFRIRSSQAAIKKVSASLRIQPDEIEALHNEDGEYFFEIEEDNLTKVVSAALKEHTENGERFYTLDTYIFFNMSDTGIAAGVFGTAPLKEKAFHPVPHYFKKGEMGRDEHGICRREGSDDCKSPPPQAIYPACLPAARARLFGAYRLLLPPDQRRWHVGTPTNPDPDPHEDGDHFTTAAMGVAAWRAIHVDDWRTGRYVEMFSRRFNLGDYIFELSLDYDEFLSTSAVAERLREEFDVRSYTLASDAEISQLNDNNWQLDDSTNSNFYLIQKRGGKLNVYLCDRSVNDAIRGRARLIKNTLERVVAGSDPWSLFAILFGKRPVYIHHAGHGWNIVGVESDGFWSHGQNPRSDALNAWCIWENGPWLNSTKDEQYMVFYDIKYPRNCKLKPEGKRLGSISMWGSGGKVNNVQFVDLPSGHSIDWTPHKEASSANVGYVWIEDESPLNSRGIPTHVEPALWDDELGFRIPVPEKDFGRCSCNLDDGCPQCRTRLNLPFWVHNTTLDKKRAYKVDLYFWTTSNRWVKQEAGSIEPLADGSYPCFPISYQDNYTMPGPLPGEAFEIVAVPDTTPGAGGKPHPCNWQPIAWRIDFHKDQLKKWHTHGIKLVLTCLDNCLVQDTRQLWFKTQIEAPY